jgi:SAM-dependent methyltransferase
MKDKEIYDKWTEFINDPKYKEHFNNKTPTPTKDMSKPDIKPKENKNLDTQQKNKTTSQKQLSELSELHKKYKTMNSENMYNYFKDDKPKWEEYHKISESNEKSFQEDEIPRNKMIKYLTELKGNKRKIIADLGCGYAKINKYFENSQRFTFHNFDHISSANNIISKDIKDTQLGSYSIDIVIMSLAMWGSNCKDYIKEAYRILDTGGTLLISEPYRRWFDAEKQENKLVKLLQEHKFKIIKNEENKFIFIECRK